MGKDWDYGVPGKRFWTEALRVAKPGALLLAFGGTRMHHRLMCAIEDAGWIIRDCLMWIYGSGFPKSHNISKAIDKAKGALATQGKGFKVAGDDGRKAEFKQGLKYRAAYGYKYNTATGLAKKWDGYGTALKPAYEPIILAMKPLDGTFAHNAEKWGVAGMWIDGGRIGTDYANDPNVRPNSPKHSHNKDSSDFALHKEAGHRATQDMGFHNSKGRFPANVLFDEEAAKMLDKQSGERKTGGGRKGEPGKRQYDDTMKGRPGWGYNAKGLGIGGIDSERGAFAFGQSYSDSGGASRFFYCAKASRKERGKDNKHPTVKPLKLMEYLCKLTKTPDGGVVLDPFMGSGTTGLACANTGRDFIGIEKEPEYFEIAERRILRSPI